MKEKENFENYLTDKSDQFPMLNLVKYLINEHDVLNEQDESKFTFNIWLQSLRWLKHNYNQLTDSKN